jgi:hypothetical protein
VYGKPALIKEQHENKWKWRNENTNDRKRTGAPRGGPKRDSGGRGWNCGTWILLATASFAIHVAMKWIRFESIAKFLVENEIVKSTNLKDNLLLSEGLSIEVVPLPHCIILLL